MNKKLLYFGTLLILLVFLIDIQGSDPKIEGDKLKFSISDLNGTVHNSSDDIFKDKVLLITLWGTWCPPCRSEIPTFNLLNSKYNKHGLEVIGIAFERDSSTVKRRSYLKDFVKDQKINYLILDGGSTKDFSKALPQFVEASGLPIEILIDRSGKIFDCRNGYGYNQEWANSLEDELKLLLKIDN